jgi:Zn-dependent peptidase ImmA (M78 family)
VCTHDYITSRANLLVSRLDTRDPFKIAQEIGISVIWWEGFNRLKGMYRVIKRNRYIFINSNLDDLTATIVCAHELGHDQLHRELAKGNGLQEFSLYNMTSRCEYEANVFAAELTLPDEDTIKLIRRGYDSEQIARCMNSDINLVALKVDALVRNGQPFRTLDHNSKFLK